MPGLNVVSFYGPIIMGVFFSCVLYGILLLQIWNYFQTYRRDGRGLKLFIFYLLVVETVETLLAIGVVFEPLIVENGKPQGTTVLPYLLPSQPVMAVLVSTPVQLFTAWRIFIITQSYWMPGLISCFSLASFGSSFYSTETTARARVIANKHKLTHPYFLITAAVTDILITVTLIYSLNRRRSHDRPTNIVIRKIMRLALQTGTITTVFTLMDSIAIFVWPKTAISFAFDFPVPKLYSNALLSSLNARSRLSRIAANLSPDELTTFRAQARNTGLFADDDDDNDNPLFIGNESSLRKRGGSSSGPTNASRFTKSSGSGAPITFARPITTITTTNFTSSGTYPEHDHELGESVSHDENDREKGKALPLAPAESSSSIQEIKEDNPMDVIPVLRVSMTRGESADSHVLEHPDGKLAIV